MSCFIRNCYFILIKFELHNVRFLFCMICLSFLCFEHIRISLNIGCKKNRKVSELSLLSNKLASFLS